MRRFFLGSDIHVFLLLPYRFFLRPEKMWGGFGSSAPFNIINFNGKFLFTISNNPKYDKA